MNQEELTNYLLHEFDNGKAVWWNFRFVNCVSRITVGKSVVYTR